MTTRKTRISPKVREAIRLMAEDGRSRSEAAKACGITDDWLYRALLRPECRALRVALVASLRESEATRSIARVAKLADESSSDHVKLGANTLLMGIEGISPVAKAEIAHRHTGLTPGLTIITGGWQPHVIEGQATVAPGAPRPAVQMIGTPARHPLALQAEEDGE